MLTLPRNENESRTVALAPVFVSGMGVSTPSYLATQEEILRFILNNFSVSERSRQLYKKTLQNPSIEKRHFAVRHLSEVMEQDLDKLNARFEREAVKLGKDALAQALADAHAVPSDVDFLAVTTCTGYLCPGLSAYLIDAAGLRRDVRSADLTGMGCGAAVPALEQAYNFLRANPGKTAAVVSVEICSAAMFSNDEPGIIISNTLFSDGAAAVILRDTVPVNGATTKPQLAGFWSCTVPAWRDTLRFRTEKGFLKNVLEKDVPVQAARAIESVLERALIDANIPRAGITRWVLHAGGEKVIDAIQDRLKLSDTDVASARTVLKQHGNMSSPTVLFVLAEERKKETPRPGDYGFLASFGAGFSAHGALLKWI